MPHLYSADRTVLYRYNDGPSDWDEHHLLQIELILSKHCCQQLKCLVITLPSGSRRKWRWGVATKSSPTYHTFKPFLAPCFERIS